MRSPQDDVRNTGRGQASSMRLNPPSSEMMRACKCFPHVGKMPTLAYNRVDSVIIHLYY